MKKIFNIGDLVKYINGVDCYLDYGYDNIVVPIEGKFYKVRGKSTFGGLLLEGVKNLDYNFDGAIGEIGFGADRFELVQKAGEKIFMTISEKRQESISESFNSIDEILDKIGKYGIKSLTDRESKILSRK